MNLALLEKRIKFPKEFEANFANFWIGINAKIVQAKSVAQSTRYDSQRVAATIDFFVDAPVPFQTNMIQFIPPEGEHFLISKIRLQEGVGIVITDTDWLPGASTAITKNSKLTINNNGINVLQSEPGTSFKDALTTRDLGELDLDEPIAWIGQTPLKASMNTIGAIVANTNVRVEVIGIAYIS